MDREIQLGWTVASNDGLGRFEPTQEVPLSTIPSSEYGPFNDLRGSDFDGDGLLEGPLPAGKHELTWDGRDAQGHPVATGVYVYRLQVDEQTHARKMVKIE